MAATPADRSDSLISCPRGQQTPDRPLVNPPPPPFDRATLRLPARAWDCICIVFGIFVSSVAFPDVATCYRQLPTSDLTCVFTSPGRHTYRASQAIYSLRPRPGHVSAALTHASTAPEFLTHTPSYGSKLLCDSRVADCTLPTRSALFGHDDILYDLHTFLLIVSHANHFLFTPATFVHERFLIERR